MRNILILLFILSQIFFAQERQSPTDETLDNTGGYIVGEIRAFAFGIASDGYDKLLTEGWLPCDGRELRQRDYRKLYRVIKFTWGSTDANVVFNIPDFRGVFLRGVSGESSRDIDKDIRVSSRIDLTGSNVIKGSSGNNVGSYQSDTLGKHSHKLRALVNSGNSAGDSKSTNNHGTMDRIETSSDGGVETRPKNIYVLYMIFTGKKLN